MKIDELPATFEEPAATFKKALKKSWLNLLAALLLFISTSANSYNTYMHVVNTNYSSAVLCIVYALITLAFAVANVAIFIKNYKRIKLNDSTF